MFDTNHLVGIVEFDTNSHDIIETYHNVRHPFDYEGEEERNNQFHEDIREQKRMMFQNILPLRI